MAERHAAEAPHTEAPKTPAQMYAMIAGGFLTALGVVGLILTGVEFNSVGDPGSGSDFLLWTTSGWTTIMWIVLGASGLATMINADAARNYSLIAGVFFAVLAVWGFLDGNDVATIFVAETTNNITHAILGGLGIFFGMPSGERQRGEVEERRGEHRTDRPAEEDRFSREERATRPRARV